MMRAFFFLYGRINRICYELSRTRIYTKALIIIFVLWARQDAQPCVSTKSLSLAYDSWKFEKNS